MAETPVSLTPRPAKPQNLRVQEQVRDFFKQRLADIEQEIINRDMPAKAAFYRRQGDLHNLQIKQWEDLTEEQRETWREIVGI